FPNAPALDEEAGPRSRARAQRRRKTPPRAARLRHILTWSLASQRGASSIPFGVGCLHGFTRSIDKAPEREAATAPRTPSHAPSPRVALLPTQPFGVLPDLAICKRPNSSVPRRNLCETARAL